MLAIRFARVGKRNYAQFQIVLQEHTVAPGGRHIEILGSYDPHKKQAALKGERIKYWISKGAKISDTAYNLFVSQGIISGEKRKVKIPARKAEPSEAGGPAKAAEVETEKPASSEPEVKAEKAEKIEKPKEETPKEEKTEIKKEEKKPKEKIPEEEKPKEEAKA